MEHNNIIELNGKRYDAVTGKYLGASQARPVPAVKNPGGKAMDGITRPSARPHHQPIEPSQGKPQSKKPVVNRQHHSPKHIDSHQPQQTKTLMRHAVPKPAVAAKKPPVNKGLNRAPEHSLAVKESVSKVNPHRQQRANLARRHQDIERFQPQTSRKLVAAPARVNPRVDNTARATTQPNEPTPRQDYNQLFEAAIAHATSHNERHHKLAKKRGRGAKLVHATIAIVAVLALGGFLAWTQRTQIELQVASWHSGFDARLPSHSLVDYQRSPIRQEHGAVVVDYQSGDSMYRITQQPSSWNSQTLLDQGVAGSSTKEIKTIESKGRLIYVHGNNASWVDGGIRYDITGNAPLNADDIAAIVGSM